MIDSSLKKKKSSILIVILLISLSVFLLSASAEEPMVTEVIINPSELEVTPGEEFIFNVSCFPGQQIKSFELNICFDPDFIQIDSVEEGTIFEGRNTFFNSGIIDNEGGSVSNVFNLIVGAGSLSSNGSLIKVSGTASSNFGSTLLNLCDLGITNESTYLPVSSQNGSILIRDFISILNPVPNNGSDHFDTNIDSLSIAITQQMGSLFNYSIVTSPDVGNIFGSYQNNGTKTCDISNLEYDTTYQWDVSVQELSSKQWMNRSFLFSTKPFTIQDIISISNLNPSNRSTTVNKDTTSISCTITHGDEGSFNYSIVTSPNIGMRSETDTTSGTKTCSISNLEYDTTYHWTVSIKDNATGEWLNKSFWFTTESEPDSNGGASESPGGGGGGFFPPPPVEDDNIPPVTPVKPSGPLYIEPGGMFSYSAQSYDPDGDLIRYRFRWGDGNSSEWTDLHLSNRTVTVSNTWFQIENFSIQVIAQDEHGLNSSWSEGLLVFSSFSEDNSSIETILPVANFSSMKPDEHNMTFSFDGSNSYDEDGEIVSYFWDFGDGSTATGLNPNHTYDEPGWYNVTLVVTDNDGNMYSKTMSVFVASSVDDSESIDNTADESTFPWLFLLIISGAAVIVVVLFGKKIFYRFFEIVEVDDQDPSSDGSKGIGKTFVDQLKTIDDRIQPFFSRSNNTYDNPIGLQADPIDPSKDEDTTDLFLIDDEPLKQEPDESRSEDTPDQPEIHRIRDLIDKKFFKDDKK